MTEGEVGRDYTEIRFIGSTAHAETVPGHALSMRNLRYAKRRTLSSGGCVSQLLARLLPGSADMEADPFLVRYLRGAGLTFMPAPKAGRGFNWAHIAANQFGTRKLSPRASAV